MSYKVNLRIGCTLVINTKHDKMLIKFIFHVFHHLSFSFFKLVKHGIPHIIVLHFITLQGGVFSFYKLKARPSTSNKIITGFIAILAILQQSGTEHAISLRYFRSDIDKYIVKMQYVCFPQDFGLTSLQCSQLSKIIK